MKTIGILNESTLHKQLKTMFSTDGAKTEKYIDKYICDIVCADGKIIEIQTSNLSKLRNKLVALLDNHKIEIIFPIIVNNWITIYNAENEDIKTDINDFKKKSTRKSPKHNTFFSIFREITGCYFLLDNENLSLHIVYIDAETIKLKDIHKQTKRGTYHIYDKKLLRINYEEIYNSLSEIISKVLILLPDTFTSKDIIAISDKKNYSYILWVLKKANAISVLEKQGRTIRYKKKI